MSERTMNEEKEFLPIKMQKICEEILSFAPTCEETEAFINYVGKSDFVTFTKDDEPLTVQFHGHAQINFVICNIRLALDEIVAPIFLDFIKKKRKRK